MTPYTTNPLKKQAHTPETTLHFIPITTLQLQLTSQSKCAVKTQLVPKIESRLLARNNIQIKKVTNQKK